jgi:hypothetical protein
MPEEGAEPTLSVKKTGFNNFILAHIFIQYEKGGTYDKRETTIFGGHPSPALFPILFPCL